MVMETAAENWRMAFMFDAREHDLAALRASLTAKSSDIVDMAEEGVVRIGVADWNAVVPSTDQHNDEGRWRSTDGTIEITLQRDQVEALPTIAQAISDLLSPLVGPGSVEIVGGPIMPQIMPRLGDAFVSLAFARDPAITFAQFSTWWATSHATLAIEVMGDHMLAYDQVHLDADLTRRLAETVGVPYFRYDAYDNVTWADYPSFLASISNAPGMVRLMADEVNRIDNATRRVGMMRLV